MIQARIPEAILDALAPGTPTAPLLAAIRSGKEEGIPAELATWIRRHGWHTGENLELLPAVVPERPVPPMTLSEQSRRRKALRLGGRLALLPTLAIPALVGWSFPSSFGRDSPEGIALLLSSLVTALFIWSALHWSPWLIALTMWSRLEDGVMATSSKAGDGAGSELVVMIAVALAHSAFSHFAFSLLLRSRGRSPWLALLGPVSLLFCGRTVS